MLLVDNNAPSHTESPGDQSGRIADLDLYVIGVGVGVGEVAVGRTAVGMGV
jgi:hypothetical protein